MGSTIVRGSGSGRNCRFAVLDTFYGMDSSLKEKVYLSVGSILYDHSNYDTEEKNFTTQEFTEPQLSIIKDILRKAEENRDGSNS